MLPSGCKLWDSITIDSFKPEKRPTPVQHLAPTKRSLRRLCALVIMGVFPLPGQAVTLEFPVPARQSFYQQTALSSYALPIGPFANGAMTTKVLEGAVSQTAWSLQAKGLTTLQILDPLRQQLVSAGFAILFECETAACGGFDFRFGIDIAAEPAMHVDLGDFRYLAAARMGPDGPDHISLIVSRSSTLGFVQMTEVGNAQASAEPTVVPTEPAAEAKPPNTASPLGDGLAKQGTVALDDLIFGSGAADLAPGEYASLEALAAYLRANPDSKVALVGHTDASGSLAGNITLSQARAASVRARMMESYAIPAAQIIAEGVGYLAPRDSNLTDQGRTRNRRVEVMLLVNP
jgi:outer membrane protein OmpA-like peptidoglycan-associated protein